MYPRDAVFLPISKVSPSLASPPQSHREDIRGKERLSVVTVMTYWVFEPVTNELTMM